MSATLTAGIASLILNIDAPLEADLVTPRDDLIGVKVWVDTSSAAFVPSAGNLVFDGNSLSITIPNLAYGTVHYVKYALISDIEPENYIVSSALSATPLESTYETDTTPPPTPTGVVFTAGITNIQVSHDVPSYLQGHGHSRTILFGKEYTGGALPTFAQAVSLAEFTGNSCSFATLPATTWRLWVVWVTNDGVVSTVPFGGTNGQAVVTGQDPSKLVDILAGQITETELGTALNARISLVDGSVNTPGTVAYQVAQEAAIRADQLQIESHTRLISVQEAAEAALDAVLAANNERVDRTADVALARTELNENLVEGLSAEASQRTILAAQLRGGYTGTDLNQVTSGLIYEEKLARAQQDSALALSISLLSAGVGEQFDWKSIWYFDTGVDGWSGNGTPTVTNGFLRPANQASSAYVTSPTGLTIDTAKYQEIRFRIRKVGSPTFAGYIWWNATAQSWDTARRQSITAPSSYDVEGIAVITLSVPWSATASVDQIRVDLSSAQTANDYFEIDWFAVGRPSPAASTAQILDEAAARAAADSAEVTARQTLSNFLFGANEPGSLTLGTIVDGIIFDEKTARSSADTSMASDITTLQSSVTTLDGEITTLQGDVTTISNTVSTLDAVTASTSTQVRAQSKQLDETAETALRNALAGDSNRVKSTNEIALARQELQANIVEGLSAEASARLTLETKVNQNNANIVENYYTKSSTDSAIAQKATLLRAYSNLSSKTFAQGTAPANRGTDPDTGSTIALQIGDLWINTSDSNSQSRWDGSSWVAATDESSLDYFITSTYDPAIQNLSDSKIESWFSTTDPSTTWTGTAASHTGDLWYNSTTKLFKRWSGSAWTTIEDKTAIDAAAAASAAQSTADGKITTFAQTTEPPAEGVGDLWIDTNDNNKPYRWNGTSWIEIRDANIAAVDARVDTVETVKIGYCTLAGATTAHADRTTCEAAGGTWNVGLPWATAVKLVSVQDANGNTASISDSFDAIKTVNDGLKASKVVKIDNNGRVSGYGLYSGATTSEFIANVDKFAVASPDSSVSLWAASTAYSVGACRRLASNSAKMFVCKVAGTSAVSAPSIAGAIGSLVTDGTVTWQIASRVPFSVVSASTVIDGVTVPPGVYIDGAMIVNETVNNQQIANAAVDNSKIANVNVDKLTAGSLQVGSYIQSDGHTPGVDGFRINADGTAEFNEVTVRGTLNSVTGTFGALTVNTNGNIKSGQTAYNTGSGFWLGNDAGTSKFSIGNASGNRLTWDGSVLSINGTASATVVSGAASGATAVQPATLTSSLAPKLEAGTSYTLTGVVTPADTGALKVGTITWNSTTGALTGGSGIAITENGIIGANAGVSKFSIDASGNATFAGELSAATGSFSGEVKVGTNPSVSGNTMTGQGVILNSDGTFAVGNSTKNLSYNGTTLTVNGDVIATGNIVGGAVSAVGSYVSDLDFRLDQWNPVLGTWNGLNSVAVNVDLSAYAGGQLGTAFNRIDTLIDLDMYGTGAESVTIRVTRDTVEQINDVAVGATHIVAVGNSGAIYYALKSAPDTWYKLVSGTTENLTVVTYADNVSTLFGDRFYVGGQNTTLRVVAGDCSTISSNFTFTGASPTGHIVQIAAYCPSTIGTVVFTTSTGEVFKNIPASPLLGFYKLTGVGISAGQVAFAHVGASTNFGWLGVFNGFESKWADIGTLTSDTTFLDGVDPFDMFYGIMVNPPTYTTSSSGYLYSVGGQGFTKTMPFYHATLTPDQRTWTVRTFPATSWSVTKVKSMVYWSGGVATPYYRAVTSNGELLRAASTTWTLDNTGIGLGITSFAMWGVQSGETEFLAISGSGEHPTDFSTFSTVRTSTVFTDNYTSTKQQRLETSIGLPVFFRVDNDGRVFSYSFFDTNPKSSVNTYRIQVKPETDFSDVKSTAMVVTTLKR